MPTFLPASEYAAVKGMAEATLYPGETLAQFEAKLSEFCGRRLSVNYNGAGQIVCVSCGFFDHDHREAFVAARKAYPQTA